jgi:hypothetical protein
MGAPTPGEDYLLQQDIASVAYLTVNAVLTGSRIKIEHINQGFLSGCGSAATEGGCLPCVE